VHGICDEIQCNLVGGRPGRSGVRTPAGEIFPIPYQTSPKTDPAFSTMGTRSPSRGKAAGPWSWSPTPFYCRGFVWVELHFDLPSVPSWYITVWLWSLPLPLQKCFFHSTKLHDITRQQVVIFRDTPFLTSNFSSWYMSVLFSFWIVLYLYTQISSEHLCTFTYVHVFIEKELDGSILEVTWAKPIQKGVPPYSRQTSRRVYPQMEYVFPAATYHPQFINVYNGRG
jgi:hypothetical protein